MPGRTSLALAQSPQTHDECIVCREKRIAARRSRVQERLTQLKTVQHHGETLHQRISTAPSQH